MAVPNQVIDSAGPFLGEPQALSLGYLVLGLARTPTGSA